MQWTLLVLGCYTCAAVAAPLTYHDQRQHGDYNIRGRLQNFVVFIIPTSSFGLFDFLPSRQHDTRNFYMTRGFQQDNTYPILQKKSFQVEEEMLVEEPVEIRLEQSVQSTQDEVVPVDISVEQVKKAKIISTTLRKADKEVVVDRLGAVKNVGSMPKLVVTPETKKDNTKRVIGLPLSEPREVVADTQQDKVQSVIGLPSRVIASPANDEVKNVVGLPSSSVEDVKVNIKAVKAKVDRRLDVDAAVTDDRAALNEKIKLLSAGIEICSPDQRRDDEGNCQTIKQKNRSGQYFESGITAGVNRVNPALSFGLSPANER